MTDPCSKELPVMAVDVSSVQVCRILGPAVHHTPVAGTLILDHDPEFAGSALNAWTAKHGMHLHFIKSGKSGI
jgi:hypothetical protein